MCRAKAQGSSHAAVGWEEGSRTICRTGCHVSSRDLPVRAIRTPRRRRRRIRDSGIACRQTRPAFAGEKAALFKVSVMITVTVMYPCLYLCAEPKLYELTAEWVAQTGAKGRDAKPYCRSIAPLDNLSGLLSRMRAPRGHRVGVSFLYRNRTLCKRIRSHSFSPCTCARLMSIQQATHTIRAYLLISLLLELCSIRLCSPFQEQQFVPQSGLFFSDTFAIF